MDEQHPAARTVDLVTARPPARAPFDPASLLVGRQPPPPTYAPGPTVVVVREFDPASFLGDRALRGAFKLATVKPLVTTIGGVEMVTVPASAYAYALRQAAAQELPSEAVEQAGPVLYAAGMLDLLLSLHAVDVVSTDQLVTATGLDHLDVGDRVADYATRSTEAAAVRFVASPEAAQVDLVDGDRSEAEAPEVHGAAFHLGQPTEAHGAALDAVKPGKHPRAAKATREVP